MKREAAEALSPTKCMVINLFQGAKFGCMLKQIKPQKSVFQSALKSRFFRFSKDHNYKVKEVNKKQINHFGNMN